MENQKSPQPLPAILFKIGQVFMALMLLLFTLGKLNEHRMNGDLFESNGFFFIGYILTLGFFCLILALALFRRKERGRYFSFELYGIAIFMFSVSAYILNLSMTVFSDFVPWAWGCIAIEHATILLIIYDKRLPKFMRYVLIPMLGISLVFSLLQVIYLAPMMVIGAIASPFLGISLHVFVPVLIILFLLRYVIVSLRKTALLMRLFWASLAFPLLFTGYFLYRWTEADNLVHEATETIITRPNNSLPGWVRLSQLWPVDWFSQKILEGSLVYDDQLFMWNVRQRGNSFSDHQKHDPLVAIALTLFEEPNMDMDTRIRVLTSNFDARHKAHRKLWSGTNLETSDVLTNMQVLPDHRMAYVEKVISIKNNLPEERWGGIQEALYTFHLPEGSVATSLSLWVNGVEEKSRLTTRGKADSAYVQIVGRERRDPALLHWQEGNRVTVTVFPCTPSEERRFRIGFTIPLEQDGDELVLKNVYFEGPGIHNALETSVVEFVSAHPELLIAPEGYEMIGNERYKKQGHYEPYWEMRFPITPLSEDAFCFQGWCYKMQPTATTTEAFSPSIIYLDVNRTWSQDEIDRVIEEAGIIPVFAWYDEWIRLEKGMDEFCERTILAQNYSLFPFHAIDQPNRALVISKEGSITPMLSDFSKSPFAEKLEGFLSNTRHRVHLWHVGNEWNGYLKSIKEFKRFNAQTGSWVALREQLASGQWPTAVLDSNAIDFGLSGTQIARDSSLTASGQAPDHLMRLFNYNLIMQHIGPHYYEAMDYNTGTLIDLANAAFVASPISSMVVLETQKDYDRFDIEKNENSLQNASTNESGGVPEPHEWFLIFMAAGVVLFLFGRDRFAAWVK